MTNHEQIERIRMFMRNVEFIGAPGFEEEVRVMNLFLYRRSTFIKNPPNESIP